MASSIPVPERCCSTCSGAAHDGQSIALHPTPAALDVGICLSFSLKFSSTQGWRCLFYSTNTTTTHTAHDQNDPDIVYVAR